MQPPIDYFAGDVQLPPLDTTGADLLGFVYKRGKYVTLVFKPRTAGTPLHTFTIHRSNQQQRAISQTTAAWPAKRWWKAW